MNPKSEATISRCAMSEQSSKWRKLAKSTIRVLLGVMVVFLVLFIASSSDGYIEVNQMTGASRSKTRHAFISVSDWKVRPTWLSESAEKQKMPTDAGWKKLSTIHYRMFVTERGCNRSPASYFVGGISPDVLGLNTPEEIDRFARDFVSADEAKRKLMLERQ